jgi:hypothetical protein
MKLILITLVALVVGLMVACGGGSNTSSDNTQPASSVSATASYVPRYTDAQVIGFIQKHLNATEKCSAYAAFRYLTSHPTYLRDKSAIRNTGPQEQYYVNVHMVLKEGSRPVEFTWTFFGDSGQVLPTSAAFANTKYRVC